MELSRIKDINSKSYYIYYLLTPLKNKIRIRTYYAISFNMQKILNSYCIMEDYAKLEGYSSSEIYDLMSIGKYKAIKFKRRWYIKK